MDWHNDIYLITPDQVVDVNKKPLGHEERQAAPLKNILGIEYKRLGIIGLLLNFGTVLYPRRRPPADLRRCLSTHPTSSASCSTA